MKRKLRQNMLPTHTSKRVDKGVRLNKWGYIFHQRQTSSANENLCVIKDYAWGSFHLCCSTNSFHLALHQDWSGKKLLDDLTRGKRDLLETFILANQEQWLTSFFTAITTNNNNSFYTSISSSNSSYFFFFFSSSSSSSFRLSWINAKDYGKRKRGNQHDDAIPSWRSQRETESERDPKDGTTRNTEGRLCEVVK